MSTVELKNIIIHKIASINDESFLRAIKTILDSKSEATVYQTTEEQKANIQEGIEHIEKGDYFTSEEIDQETNQWLAEK